MQERIERLKEQLQAKVLERMDIGVETDEETLWGIIEEELSTLSSMVMISLAQREELGSLVFNGMRRFGILQELLEDDSVTEIMINGYRHIFIERAGSLFLWDKCFSSHQELEDIAQRIAAWSNRIVNETTPILDTRLCDGSRVNIVLRPVSIDGAAITIRKFYDTPITIERLIALGSISEEAAEFCSKAVRARYNIFISGGTGSGKTTFLNALSNFIPADERIITIEDSAELQIHDVGESPRNLVRLETRNANMEGENAITIRDLIKSALRMRPSRIIVGEIRGAEAIDMLQAMNTGMDGSLSTGHSNSSKDMLTRIETMVLMGMDMPVSAIRNQIASAIDIIIHLGRLRDKTRKVLQISEVLGCVDGEIRMNPVYVFEEETQRKDKVVGRLKKVGDLQHVEKFAAAGIRY